MRSSTKDVQGLPLNTRLATGVDLDLSLEIDGIFSIADVVDAELPAGLEGASNRDVKETLAAILADDASTVGLRGTLGKATSERPDIEGGSAIWRAGAFTSQLRYDLGSFEGATDEDQLIEAEGWLIEAQTVLRGDVRRLAGDAELNVWGIAIDFNTAFEKSFEEGGPFIFLAVALIVLLVGALLRSYWSAAVVAVGLGVTMLSYNGVVRLIQLDTSPLLQLIVPIAMISFGVDFFIHGAGRTREAQVDGASRARAYPIGASAVFTALLLAALTSAAAFLSNAVSGIEAITEFGIGAAIALLLAYMFLGVVAPRVLLGIEDKLGPRPTHARRKVAAPFRQGFDKGLFSFAAIFAGVMVSMTVVFPTIGAPLFLIFLLFFIYLPYRWTKRRNRRAAEEGRELTDEIKGAGHGFSAAGSCVHFVARWRVVTLPLVGVMFILGIFGFFLVKQEFEFSDFLPSDTDAVRSLD